MQSTSNIQEYHSYFINSWVMLQEKEEIASSFRQYLQSWSPKQYIIIIPSPLLYFQAKQACH